MFGLWKKNRNIVEKRVVISVGEPWDFTSIDGENILNGVIVSVLHRPRGQIWVELDVTPFDRGGKKVRKLFATNRYEKDGDIIKKLIKGQNVDANFYASIDADAPLLAGSISILNIQNN